MNCETMPALIGLHIDGEATPEQEKTLAAHLAECESCRALATAYEQINSGVLSLEAEVPERFCEGVMYRVRQESTGKKPRRVLSRHFGALAAAAAALALLVGTGTLTLPHGNRKDAVAVQDVAESAPQVKGAAVSAEGGALAVPESTDADAKEEADVDTNGGYDAVYDALGDSAAPLERAELTLKEEPDMLESADAAPAEAASSDAQSVCFAAIYGCRAEDIPELAALTPVEGEPDAYRGTLVQVQEIIATYSGQYATECDYPADGAADEMLAILRILPE